MTTTIEAIANNQTPSLGRQLFGIIDQPVTTFKAVLARRSWSTWALPLFVVILTFAAMTVVQIPYTLELAREQAESQLASLSPEQVEAARQTMEFTLSLPFMLATSLGFGVIFLIGGLLVQSAFLYFGALIVGGDDMSFGSIFAMSSWARIPMAIGLLVQGGFTLVAQHINQYPGLSFLVGTGDLMKDARDPLFVLLGGIDLFWVWHLALAVLGLSVVARISRGKSLMLIILYAALALGITVLPTLIFAGTLGG